MCQCRCCDRCIQCRSFRGKRRSESVAADRATEQWVDERRNGERKGRLVESFAWLEAKVKVQVLRLRVQGRFAWQGSVVQIKVAKKLVVCVSRVEANETVLLRLINLIDLGTEWRIDNVGVVSKDATVCVSDGRLVRRKIACLVQSVAVLAMVSVCVGDGRLVRRKSACLVRSVAL